MIFRGVAPEGLARCAGACCSLCLLKRFQIGVLSLQNPVLVHPTLARGSLWGRHSLEQAETTTGEVRTGPNVAAAGEIAPARCEQFRPLMAARTPRSRHVACATEGVLITVNPPL